MEQMLYEAAMSEASAASLPALHVEDRQNLITSFLKASPLHLAALCGNLEFVQRVVHQIPELAEAVDSRRQTPLHLASAKGHINIVHELVSANVNMCMSCDIDGRNPLHVASMNGNLDVLEALVRACPLAAQARVDRDETILQLCVKYNQVGALELLVGKPELQQLVNAKDADGNTVFHLAVSVRNFEIVEVLLAGKEVDVNVKNTNGDTAMDILLESGRRWGNTSDSWRRVHKCIRERGAERAKYIEEEDWLAKKKDGLIVVAALIATVTFQVVMSPPGGFWQDTTEEHKAGQTIMAYNSPKNYTSFLYANTLAFVLSLTVILLLASDVRIRGRMPVWGLVIYTAVAAYAMFTTYAVSIYAVTPHKLKSTSNQLRSFIITWASCMTAGIIVVACTQFAKPYISARLVPFIRHPTPTPQGTV